MKTRSSLRVSKSSAPKSLQVTSDQGAWLVKREDSQRTTSRHASQAEAVAAARRQLKVSGGQLSVLGKDGRMRSTYTLGRRAMAKLNAVEGISLPSKLRGVGVDEEGAGQSRQQRRDRIRRIVTAGTSSKR